MSNLDRLDDLDQDDAGKDVDTVLDVLLSELDPERLHGLSITRQDGDTIYLVVSQTTTQHTGAQALDLRTCVVDLDDESVSIPDAVARTIFVDTPDESPESATEAV